MYFNSIQYIHNLGMLMFLFTFIAESERYLGIYNHIYYISTAQTAG